MSGEFDILVNKSHELNSLCRICLTKNATKTNSLFEVRGSYSFSERIMRCTKIIILDGDGMPGNICEPCVRELDAADSFRVKCENSDELLRKYYLNCILENEKRDKTLTEKSESTAMATENPSSTAKKEECNSRKAEARITDAKVEKSNITLENYKTSKNNILEKYPPAKSKKETSAGIKLEKEELEDTYDSSNEPCPGETFDTPVEDKAPGKKYHCNLCSKPLSTKYSLEKHITRMHANGKMRPHNVSGFGRDRLYKCTECPYSTPHSQYLKYHTRIHTGEKPFRCSECPRSFSQPSGLNCHRKTHSDTMYYTCAQCGRQFKHKEVYEKHKEVHSEIKKYTCKICNKGLKSRSTLEGHMNRHYNIRNHSCETCGSTFVTSVELLNHSKKHLAEKKFQCDFCDFRSRVKKGLKQHQHNRHSGERPFKCELCEYAAQNRGCLKRHMVKHTREKNYSCPVCPVKFTANCSVKKHVLRLHGTSALN